MSPGRARIIEATIVDPSELPPPAKANFARITNEDRILTLMRDAASGRTGRMVCAAEKNMVPVALGAVTAQLDGRVTWALMAKPTQEPAPALDDGHATVWFTHQRGIYGFRTLALAPGGWRFRLPSELVRYSRRMGPRHCAKGSGLKARVPLVSGRWMTAEAVVDISTGGLCIDIDDRFEWPDNALTQLELRIDRRKPFGAVAVVRHSRPGPAYTRRYGLQFVDLETTARLTIGRLTERLRPLHRMLEVA